MIKTQNFFKNHADTLSIIAVNIAIAAILISMSISNSSRIDAANTRMDTIHVMFYDLLREGRK